MSWRASLSTAARVSGEAGNAGTRTLLLPVVGPEGDSGVVLDEYLDDEGPIAVTTLYGLEEAGLADAVGC